MEIKSKLSVGIKTSFIALHCYPEAPNAVSFLRDMHRHVFHVNLETEVSHDDRDIEFILLKEDIDKFISSRLKLREWPDNVSCEMIATDIGNYILENYKVNWVKVLISEDDENYAVVELERC